MKEAEYPEGAIQNRVLRDTIISGLASDKIRAKVIKEGKDVTLDRVMEIAHLEVSIPETHWPDAGDCERQLRAVQERSKRQEMQAQG